MKNLILIAMLLISKVYAYSQKIPEDYGYRHLQFKFQNDPVDVIVISKKGEERIPKPLFFFCQGSLPQPVVKYDEKGLYGTLPFDENPFLNDFHIVIVGKPFVPIISDVNKLGKDFMYLKDIENEIPPKGYIERNYLDYYVFRNNFILRQLAKERWVRNRKLVVAGHSEGSSIAVKMAATNKKITHLIYSGGNPYGRIMSILAQSRFTENDSVHDGSNTIDYWKTVVDNSKSISFNGGDSFKTTFDFSQPQNENLSHLKIPVLVTYGTKDWSSPYNDLFRIEAIREKKSNFTFIDYPNLDHNFFPVNEERKPNYEIYNWDKVAKDWLIWLEDSVQ
ncbi:alpha/beta hydrolase family protein [Flavobacterium sp. 3HN19-14]|uniref:alpha/beta hydrolase family protein n=1 Tax=Flavobacterium sp. 3HN19-14 TaxID=3448133 RepID=UPI003EE04223